MCAKRLVITFAHSVELLCAYTHVHAHVYMHVHTYAYAHVKTRVYKHRFVLTFADAVEPEELWWWMKDVMIPSVYGVHLLT